MLPDMNAAGLFQKYENNKVVNGNWREGCLLFYGENNLAITHVMIALTRWNNGVMILVGARGGDSSTTTLDAAKKQKAFVDVVWGDYWYQKIQWVVDPFKI